MNYKNVKLKELCSFQEGYVNPKQSVHEYFDGDIKWLRATDINDTYIYETGRTLTNEGFNSAGKSAKLFEPNTIAISKSGTIGRVGIIKDFMCGNRAVINIIPNNELVNTKYLYYYLKLNRTKLENMAQGSVQKNLYVFILEELDVILPNIQTQEKIVNILGTLDDKIYLNNKLAKNLENQLKEQFNKLLTSCEDYETKTLYDELNVIDNRGKTPPIVNKSEYPIIDVKVLTGENRIINYNDCIKFVDKDTYNNFFRNGHPQKYDILLSTVGSLAEMKIYMENKGTIAQNIIALRPKNKYPLFMYQYLKYLKNTLTSYDIGSVQPSIKVTQFMKEEIKIPNIDVISKFENIANLFTEKIFNLEKQNRIYENIRDVLIGKLIRGEIKI